MASQAEDKCPDHPTKQLLFVCLVCNKLICKRCKLTDHEGHTTKDVAKFAEDARSKLQAKRHMEVRLTKVDTQIWAKQKDLDDLEGSIENMKDTLKERGQQIKQWVDKHVRKKQDLVDRYAAKIGHKALAEEVKQVEQRREQLKNEADTAAELLEGDYQDYEVCQYVVSMNDKDTTVEEDSDTTTPRHESHVFLPDTDFVQWKSALRDFLGLPHHAQSSAANRDMAVAHTLTASTDRHARVLGVHVTDSGHLCVALLCCEGGPGKSAAVLRVYDRVGKLVTEQDLPKMVRVVMTSSPGGKLLVVCTYSGAKVSADLNLEGSQSDPATDELSSKVYSFNRDPSSENKLTLRKILPGSKKELYKLYEVGADSSRAVNTVQVDDPQHVVADASGEYFAVIHQGKVAVAPTAQAAQPSSITVFRKPTLSPSRKAVELEKRVEWRPDAAPSTPSTPLALCFTGRQRQWLAVLDAASDAVYMLDYEDGRGVLTAYVSGCPLVHRPSAVTSDPKGRLVLGCRGGVVVTVVPREEVAEAHYIIPKQRTTEQDSEYDDDDDLDDTSSDEDEEPGSGHQGRLDHRDPVTSTQGQGGASVAPPSTSDGTTPANKVYDVPADVPPDMLHLYTDVQEDSCRAPPLPLRGKGSSMPAKTPDQPSKSKNTGKSAKRPDKSAKTVDSATKKGDAQPCTAEKSEETDSTSKGKRDLLSMRPLSSPSSRGEARSSEPRQRTLSKDSSLSTPLRSDFLLSKPVADRIAKFDKPQSP